VDIRSRFASVLSIIALLASMGLAAMGDQDAAGKALALSGSMGLFVIGLHSDPHQAPTAEDDDWMGVESNPPMGVQPDA